MWIEIINGPNLARIGQREPSIYGTMSMDACLELLHQRYDSSLRLTYFQSNHEGALLDRLYELHDAGAYSHPSLALAEAVCAITPPAVEVHISNVYQREPLRQQSLIARACRGSIVGFGMDGYRLAIEALCSALPPSTNKLSQ